MGGSQHTDHLMQILPIVFMKRYDHQATDEGRHGPQSGQSHAGRGHNLGQFCFYADSFASISSRRFFPDPVLF